MIVKNEEQIIERCLNSVAKIVDEIIIVDTGSTDRTKELCLKYTKKVYDFQWINDFSAARNYSYSHATKDYILWLDADDILFPEDIIKFIELKKTLSKGVHVVMMKYATGHDNKGNVIFSYYRERLTKRACNFQWKEPVHEHLEAGGRVFSSDILITHAKPYSIEEKSTRNIEIYENHLKSGIPLSARGTYYYARELKDHKFFEAAIEQFTSFLDSDLGWVEDNINSCSELGKCYLEIDQPQKALESFFRSFAYDRPRAELCCQIGYFYQNQEDFKSAAFWFELILTLEKPSNIWGFVQQECWDYIPFIECTVCYDRLGDYKRAQEYNNQALLIQPNSISALKNQMYLESKIKQENK
jgi:glycosyltransferase involved in cell wall biosynthesis